MKQLFWFDRNLAICCISAFVLLLLQIALYAFVSFSFNYFKVVELLPLFKTIQ